MFIPLVILVLVGILVYELTGARRRLRVELRGTASAPGGMAVAMALARREGLRVLVHPAFFIGLALTGVAVTALGVEDPPNWREDAPILGLFLFPYCGMVLIAVALAVSRARRLGTDELFQTLPASDGARSAGHLLSVAWPVVASAAIAAVTLAYAETRGAVGTPDLAEVASGPVLVACAGAVGVLVGRWFPVAVAAPLAVIALGFFEGLVLTAAGPEELSPLRAFAPWHAGPDGWPTMLTLRRPGWHLVYLVGLGAIAASVAFMRRAVDRRHVVALGVALGLVALGGIAQARPIPEAELDRLAAMVWAPSRFQHCERRGEVTYCAYRGSEELIARWAPPVDGVRAAAPVRTGSFLVGQRVAGAEIRNLPGELRSRFQGEAPPAEPFVWPDDAGIHPGLDWCVPGDGSCELGLAAAVAFRIVGLPLSRDPRTAPRPSDIEGYDPYRDWTELGVDPAGGMYDARGEARAAVALWLAAQATPGARTAFTTRFIPTPSGSNAAPFALAGCDNPEASVLFGIREGAVARALLDIAPVSVTRVLSDHWSEAIDPGTRTDQLMGWFGIEPSSIIGTGTYRAC